jgi:hypothetical protein
VVACVNDLFQFCFSNTKSISFVHSFLLSSFWWFGHGETTFLFWSLLVKKSPHQQQQTNNIKSSSCIFGNPHSTYIRWMFLTKLGIIINSDGFNNMGDHSKLSTFRLWLPVSMIFFTHFCSNTTSISFVHLFLLSSFRCSFKVELRFYFGHYWGQEHQQKTQTNNIMMSSCIFGKLLFTFRSLMISTILGIILN